MKYTIDINADLGEGFPFDAHILPLVSSCSIACGGHYGDDESIRKTIQLAKSLNVKVGAHPSFPDKENFGRKVIKIADADLHRSLVDQMNKFFRVCMDEQVTVNHIKLHGALYNLTAYNKKMAEIVLQSILEVSSKTTVYLPGNSEFYAKANGVLPLKREAFIDRSYTDKGQLVSRNFPGAIIKTPEKCFKQLVEMVIENRVTTITGKQIRMQAETFCIHGDHQYSVMILNYLRQNLEQYNIQVE